MDDDEPTPDRGIGLTAQAAGLDPNAFPHPTVVLRPRRRIPWGLLVAVALVVVLVAGVVVVISGRKSTDHNRREGPGVPGRLVGR